MNYITKPGKKFFFEKWYFDVQDNSGFFLFAYMAPLTLGGFKSAELVVSLYTPDGKEERQSYHISAGDVRISSDKKNASFSLGAITSSGGETELTIDSDKCSIRLVYNHLSEPWIPGGDGLLLKSGKRSLYWSVPVPAARVKGNIRMGSRKIEVEGLGYHDFVQTDIPPWKLPLRELLWGRALGEEGAVIWNRPVFYDEEGKLPVMHGWSNIDGKIKEFTSVEAVFLNKEYHKETDGSYPVDMEIIMKNNINEEMTFSLTQTSLLLGANVADVQQFRNSFERMMYRKFTGNPVEYKLFSDSFINETNIKVRAAHEWVLWGDRR